MNNDSMNVILVKRESKNFIRCMKMKIEDLRPIHSALTKLDVHECYSFPSILLDEIRNAIQELREKNKQFFIRCIDSRFQTSSPHYKVTAGHTLTLTRLHDFIKKSSIQSSEL